MCEATSTASPSSSGLVRLLLYSEADRRTRERVPTSSRTTHQDSDNTVLKHRYWLGDINRNAHVAARFLLQDEYSLAAPLETDPPAEVTTRIFMLFRGVQ